MAALPTISFEQDDLFDQLVQLDQNALDSVEFGVIGFDDETVVRLYNACEAKYSGLSADKVLKHHLFTVVAPCMNNFMVAQRFEDAGEANTTLDATIDYVLTLRMRPQKVKLRLLAKPGGTMRYVLVKRTA